MSEYLREPPDVSLIIGSRINDIATNGWSLPISGSVGTIQIDRDPSLLGRNPSLSLGLVGDAQAVVSGLLSRPSGRPRPRNYPRCRSVRAELAWADSVPLKPARVLHGLASAFPGATWCSDIGEHLCQAVHHLRFDSPDQFHVLLGLGSMGSGLGLAMGFKQAHPTRTVIGLCGDGGFLAHIGEVMTCVENRINVVFAVFNDGRWNMVHHGFRAAYGAIPTCLPERVADLAAVAQGLGALGVCVTQPSDLDPERLAILASSGKPLVLDIRIDADEALAQDTRTASLRHFMTSRS